MSKSSCFNFFFEFTGGRVCLCVCRAIPIAGIADKRDNQSVNEFRISLSTNF